MIPTTFITLALAATSCAAAVQPFGKFGTNVVDRRQAPSAPSSAPAPPAPAAPSTPQGPEGNVTQAADKIDKKIEAFVAEVEKDPKLKKMYDEINNDIEQLGSEPTDAGPEVDGPAPPTPGDSEDSEDEKKGPNSIEDPKDPKGATGATPPAAAPKPENADKAAPAPAPKPAAA